MHGREPLVLKVLLYTEIVTAESAPSQGFPPEQGVCWGWGRESKTRHEQRVPKPVTGTCDPFYAECTRKVFHKKIFEVVKHQGWTDGRGTSDGSRSPGTGVTLPSCLG